MYDRKNEANEFVGESVEDASAKARRFYGIEANEIKVVSAEAGEVYGAGGRVVVVAIPRSVRPPSPDRGGRSEGRREGRGREREGRGGREERGGRGERHGGRDRENGGPRGDNRGEPARAAAPRAEIETAPPPVGPSKGVASGEIGAIGHFVLGVIERMKLGGFEISESTEDEFVIYQVRGEASVALRAGDGRAVDALQMLANQAAKRSDEDAPRIVVDVEGDASNREDSLTQLAERAAKRARETGRAIALDPMNSRDRRIIHLSIREGGEGVATMSIGSGRYRQVVVVPEGAPEYAEAVASSGAAGS
jgi:predicted RNA-binding protein Jag